MIVEALVAVVSRALCKAFFSLRTVAVVVDAERTDGY